MMQVIKKFMCCSGLLLCSLSLLATHTQIVEIDVKGLTCSFCIYGLQDNLEEHPDIEQADISIKQSKARIHLTPKSTITLEEIREIIKDAGFESGDYQHYGNEEHPCETSAC